MLRTFLFICFFQLLAGIATAQQTAPAGRAGVQHVLQPAERFAVLHERLQQAYTTGDQGKLAVAESAVFGAMRQELEYAETAGLPRLARERAIFAALENFTFHQAKPADAEAKFQLLAEFQRLMQ